MHWRDMEHVVLALAAEHVPILARLPADYRASQALIGKVKTITSLAVKDALPGSGGSRGCALAPVNSDEHCASTHNDITNKQERRTYMWERE